MTDKIKERLAALRDQGRSFYATYPMAVTSVCTDALAALNQRDERIAELERAIDHVTEETGYYTAPEADADLRATIARLTDELEYERSNHTKFVLKSGIDLAAVREQMRALQWRPIEELADYTESADILYRCGDSNHFFAWDTSAVPNGATEWMFIPALPDTQDKPA